MNMTDDITASTSKLFEDAPSTALYYYGKIAQEMDDLYGKGWSEKHSETVARLCQVAATDFHTSITNRTLQQLRDKFICPPDSL